MYVSRYNLSNDPKDIAARHAGLASWRTVTEECLAETLTALKQAVGEHAVNPSFVRNLLVQHAKADYVAACASHYELCEWELRVAQKRFCDANSLVQRALSIAAEE